MKIKTSVTLSAEILKTIEAITSKGQRSEFIEMALWKYLDLVEREKRNYNDKEIYETYAERLNEEAEDSIAFQDDV